MVSISPRMLAPVAPRALGVEGDVVVVVALVEALPAGDGDAVLGGDVALKASSALVLDIGRATRTCR